MNRLVTNGLAVLMLASMHGCRQTVPTHTVCLVDVSKSITPQGLQAEFEIVDNQVDRMHRGDRLTVIPINGNAAADTPGTIVAVTAPVDRQAYDADMVAFRLEAHRDIEALRSSLIAKPASHTDILGALDVVQEEFNVNNEDGNSVTSKKALYVFSDFIEDAGSNHFMSSQVASATDAATRLRSEHHLSLPNSVTVSLTKLPSTDARRLSNNSQVWVRTFWSEYFLPSSVRWESLPRSRKRNTDDSAE